MRLVRDAGSMTNDALATSSSTSWLRPLRWSEPTVNGGPGGAEFALPVGTVTFLLTDVEGSTSAWQAAPGLMGAAIARHYQNLDLAVSAHGGVRPQEQGEGDSIVAAFGRASDALMAAVDAQRALAAEPWPDGLAKPLRVRMAIHTGEAQLRDEANYVGQAIIRTARLRAIAHGGQVLVSQAVRDLVIDQIGDRVELLDLGLHRLKDLARPEHVWQVAGSGLGRDFPPPKSLDTIPNNLPIELSSFVGRQGEIATVSTLVTGNRLVTITGSGGAGKTRLAQQVAAQVSDHFPDGTWWIELAPVDASAVRSTIAAVVSIAEPDRLVERLAGHMLLVLDNCEHVLDTIGPLVHQIMAQCPDVSVVATSRGPLDVPGEITWRVPPLGIPTTGEPVPIERLAQFDAVHLFVDRARRARPNFALTTDNGPAVAELCARLDGIPLAIELAAARAKSLTAEQILAGLEDSLRLLTGGSRLVMPRQQTLEASIQWSHDLLGDPERVLLRRLAVFAGGWDLEAAEAICSDSPGLPAMEVLDCLEHLIDQSLVRVEERGGVARYQLLETVRQFAARRLAEFTEERNDLIVRHTNWYARVAAELGPLVEGPAQESCLPRLSAERDNMAAALRHLRAAGDGVALASFVLHCAPFWDAANTPADGRTWTTAALALLGDHLPELRAPLLAARANSVWLTGTMGMSDDDPIAALELAERLGDRHTAGRARVVLARSLGHTDPEGALAMLALAAEDSRAAGDRFNEARSKSSMVGIYAFRGELHQARIALEDAEQVVRQVVGGNLLIGWNANRAMIWMYEADHAGMRSALMSGGPNDVGSLDNTVGLRALIDVALRSDLGDECPQPEDLEARVRHAFRIENYFAAMALNMALLRVLQLQDQPERARAVADESARMIPLPIWALHGAMCSLALHDPEGAKARLGTVAQQLPQAPVNFRLVADVVATLLARHDGEMAIAEATAHQGLTLAAEHGYTREIVDSLELLAGLAAAQGSWSHAARLGGAAHQARESHPLKARIEPIRSMLAVDLEAARAALGDAVYTTAFDEGRQLPLDEAVAYAQRMRGERSRPTLGWASLTPTERRVVDLARRGRSNPQIAAELLMGTETVKTHLSRVYAKLGVANRTELAAVVPPASGD